MKALLAAVMIPAVFALIGLAYDNPKGTPPWVAKTMLNNVYAVSDRVYSENRVSLGTGFWIDERHMITNCHVAGAFQRKEWPEPGVSVTTYKDTFATNYDETKTFRMKTVLCDEETDLALLKSYWPNHDARLVTIDWRTPRFGEALYSAGYGINLTLTPKYGYTGIRVYDGVSSVRVTMPIVGGDSGSPVFDKWGRLRGVINKAAMQQTMFGFVPVADRAMMIPALEVMLLLEEFYQEGEL